MNSSETRIHILVSIAVLLTCTVLFSITPQYVLDEIAEGRARSALKAADSLVKVNPSDPYSAYVHALALYEEGMYKEAADAAERSADRLAVIDPSNRKEVISVHDYLRDSWKLLREFKKVEGRSFSLSYYNPKDSILAFEVFRVLDSAKVIIGRDLGYIPEDTVRVEIYPDKASFISVSTLTEDEVKRTGTIALCKFNRIMIISPRALLRGYKWRETLCHEYVHFVLHRMAGTRLPLWIHEAIARFEEVRFDGRTGGNLSQSEKGLLSRAVRNNSLITFARMYPSMAKLKNATETGTAFAEVHLAMKLLHEKCGYPCVRTLIKTAISGGNTDSLISERYLFDFIKSMPVSATSFADTSGPVFTEDGESEAGENSYQKWVRLADKLLKEKRSVAAIKELERASVVAGGASSWVFTQMAVLYSDNGENEKALSALNKAIDLFPDDCNAYFRRARLNQKLGHVSAAADDARRALEINPFHGEARELLLEALDPEVNREEYRREMRNGSYLYKLK
ncbi:MAG: tetratricopeptide repeat protein [Fibrobacteres bacterium]|nr:tetratricopeptide repeat protein [Fibrobacterota bacterium]